jgi:holo-[acyl-carrier protein] synthase
LKKESHDSTDPIFGLGTDIVEIQRFRDLDWDAPFFARVFTRDELVFCRKFVDNAPHFAATFAGKEAIVKAMNRHRTLSVSEVEILRDLDGSPNVLVEDLHEVEILVSLSHSEKYAVAVALVIPKAQLENVELFRKLLNETTQTILPRQ